MRLRLPNDRSSYTWFGVGLVTLVYLLGLLAPWRPVDYRTGYSLPELSYRVALNAAAASRWQFGRDIIFTYGPLGFLADPVYQPKTYWPALAAWVVFAAVFFSFAWGIARRFVPSPAVAFLWLGAIFAVVGGGPRYLGLAYFGTDYFFVATGTLVLVCYFYAYQEAPPRRLLLLVGVLGLGGLIKFPYLVIGVLVVGAVTVDRLFRRRPRDPWPSVVYAGCLLAGWIAAGQGLANLWSYLKYSSELSQGYTHAMQGAPEEKDAAKYEVFEYAVAALALFATAAASEWRTRRYWGVVPLAGLAGILFLVFKAAFVRHVYHVLTGPPLLFALALLCVPVFWARSPDRLRRAGCLVAVILSTAAASTTATRYLGTGLPWYLAVEKPGEAVTDLTAAGKLATGRANYGQQAESAMAALRANHPLPPIEGTVDVYPRHSAIAYAHGLDVRSRPVIQSYAAYTPALAELNAAHLRGASAPGTILFDVDPIDERFPALEDGLSWPELLTRYDVTGRSESFLLLRRAAVPRTYTLTPVADLSARFADFVDLPAVDGPVWAEIDIRETFWCSVMAAVYKPPVVRVWVQTRGGVDSYRVVTALARAGFLLSPLVKDRDDFAALASTTWAQDLGRSVVRSIRFSVEVGGGRQGSSVQPYFQPQVRVRLYRLDFPHQPPVATAPAGDTAETTDAPPGP